MVCALESHRHGLRSGPHEGFWGSPGRARGGDVRELLNDSMQDIQVKKN